MTRILVIRLGALGDFVLSFAAFAAIRAHHRDAEITLLTTAPFASLAEAAPWFDRVMIDRKPAWWDLPALWRLSRQLRGFAMVYDLQTSGRSSRYFRLAGRPPWSGIARGCAYPHADPARETTHTLERQRDQLAVAGITAFPTPDLAWLGNAATPTQPYALLVPGAAAHRPEKRWPVQRYAELAGVLAARGITPMVIGAAAERPLAAAIQAACPAARDLTGQTSIPDIHALAARARIAIGNDTGPMHLAAAAGCPCVVLFSGASDPALSAPRGPGGTWPRLLRVENLSDLPVAGVVEALA